MQIVSHIVSNRLCLHERLKVKSFFLECMQSCNSAIFDIYGQVSTHTEQHVHYNKSLFVLMACELIHAQIAMGNSNLTDIIVITVTNAC